MLVFLFLGSISFPISAQDTDRKKNSVKTQTSLHVLSFEPIDLNRVNNRQILIKGTGEVQLDVEEMGCEAVFTPDELLKRNIVLARIPEAVVFEDKLQELGSLPGVERVEPDMIIQAAFIPNDPNYHDQWHLPAVNLPAAWDYYQGSAEILVAVLDTGVDYNHPDLQERIMAGYDFYYNDSDPMDDVGHGTMVAGIIAAVSNNEFGVAGVDQACKILPVKAGISTGFKDSAIIAGIQYAMDQGADIINMSFGGKDMSQEMKDILWDAYEKGIILVAASGNDNTLVYYPAALPPVISVGATNIYDVCTSFSNYGEKLDLTAPGSDIYSTTINNNYKSQSGTSFSAPIVSGIAALLKGRNPSLTPAEVEYLLERSASRQSDLQWNNNYGYGRVNAVGSMETLLPLAGTDAADTRGEAQPILLNQDIFQTFGQPNEDDWFCFQVRGGSGLVSIDVISPSSLDPVLWVDRIENDQVAWERQIDGGEMGESEQLTFTAIQGTYYLQLYDYNGHWLDQPYTVHISTAVHSPTDLNIDGLTNLLDLAIVAGNYGCYDTPSESDLNHDGIVDLFDLILLSRQI